MTAAVDRLPCPCSSAPWAPPVCKVSRLGLGTLTWGRDTDEHEARDQLIAFAEAGGTLSTPRPGYGDGASEELIGTLIGDVVARDDVVLATKAGISRTPRRPRDQRLPRPPAHHARRVAEAARRRPRRPVAGAHLGRRHPARGDARRARLRGRDRAGGVRRHLELLRLADRPGGDLAAGGARPGDRWPRRRWSTPCSTAAIEHEVLPAAAALGLGVLPWSPLGRGVLTGKYRTGTPVGLPRRVAALRELRRAVPRRPLAADRRGGRPGRRRPRLDPARGGAGLGARPARRHRPDRRRPHRRPAARAPWASRT